jgi:hypothetical protein
MRFLVDENTGVAVARWLLEKGHEVFSVYEQARGIDEMMTQLFKRPLMKIGF